MSLALQLNLKRALVDEHPTVDVNRRAGHKRGEVRGQKQKRASDFSRARDAPHRDRAQRPAHPASRGRRMSFKGIQSEKKRVGVPGVHVFALLVRQLQ
jgi:hypothetical protein